MVSRLDRGQRGTGWLRALAAGCAASLMLAAPALAGNPKDTPPPTKQPKPEGVDLAIAKTPSAAQVTPGDTVTWTVTVTNVGTVPVSLNQLSVDDPTTPLTTQSTNLKELLPKQQITFTGTSAVTTNNCDGITNIATVSVVNPKDTPTPLVDVNPANNTATAGVMVNCAPPPSPPPPTVAPVVQTPPVVVDQCPVPALHAAISAPHRVKAGRRIRVGLTVRNTSADITATTLVGTYRVPVGTTLAKRLPRGAHVRRGVVRLTWSALPNNGSRTVWITGRPAPTVAS